jgi:hypothetical protein
MYWLGFFSAALAAATYALEPIWDESNLKEGTNVPYMWPFENGWYKPDPIDRVRELQKAGALIAAEIDRLNRIQ